MESKKEKGVTLIALIITIIVLLILAGVTISAIAGRNGVLNQAANSAIETEKATALEEVSMGWSGIEVDYYEKRSGNPGASFSSVANKEKLESYLKENGKVNTFLTNDDGTYYIEYTSNGNNYWFKAYEDGKVEFFNGIAPDKINLQIVKTGSNITKQKAIIKMIIQNEDISPENITWSITEGNDFVNLLATTGKEITIEAKSAGTATVSAKTNDGKYVGSCKIIVTEVKGITSIGNLDPTFVDIDIGTSITVKAPNVQPADATEKLQWEIADTNIANLNVADDGKSAEINGVGVGVTSLTVKSSSGAEVTTSIRVLALADELGEADPNYINYYGYEVKGYTAKNYTGQWRLFYRDDKNTYIEADAIEIANSIWTYPSGKYKSVANVRSAGRRLNKELNDLGMFLVSSNTDKQVLRTAYLTDNWNWTQKYGNNNYLESYVIGSPTEELYTNSLNAVTKENYSFTLTEDGYHTKVKNDDSAISKWIRDHSTESYNEIYAFQSNPYPITSMTLSSPGLTDILWAWSGGGYSYYYGRPIACISNSKIDLKVDETATDTLILTVK